MADANREQNDNSNAICDKMVGQLDWSSRVEPKQAVQYLSPSVSSPVASQR